MKALFLGLGGVGQRHLRNLRELRPDCEIAAVRSVGRRFEIGPDLRADATTDIEQKYAIRRFPDIATAIRDFAPDCAVVASPTSAHAAQTLALAAHRIPVLLEKPVCATEAELTALLAAASPVMVAYMLRFNPAVEQLMRWVASGRLGRIYAVDMVANSFMPAWHPYEAYDQFYAGRKDLGGGAILTEVHLSDLLHSMFGLPRRLWTIGGSLSPFGLEVEDCATALMEFERDGRALPVTLAISFVQRPVRFGITVKGERGVIAWDLLETTATFTDAESGTCETFAAPAFQRNAMFVAEMRHFLDHLDDGEFVTALPKVAGGQRIALALMRSLQSGAIVEVS